MSFDDDKVRKNLVVAGATVIATHYLGLPIYDILIERLSLGKYLVDKLHLTQLGLAIFVYLGLMFRFSDPGKNYSFRVMEDGAKLARERSIRWATKAITRYLSMGIEPKWILTPALVEGFSELLESRPPEAKNGPHLVYVHPTERNAEHSPMLFLADIGIHWTPMLNNPGNDHSRGTTVELTRLGVALLRFLTFMERHFYTETATMVLLPVLLGNLAVACMVYKVLGLYLATS